MAKRRAANRKAKSSRTAARKGRAAADRRTSKKATARRRRKLRAVAKRTARPVRNVSATARPSRTGSARTAAAGRKTRRVAPGLGRRRRTLEEIIPTPPSSLNLDRHASAVRSGHAEILERIHEHTETSPAMTAGDVDADWQKAYDSGDEAPGGDNPTPDQDIVDDIGKALGVEYQDNEELRASDKVTERDKHRWELDPASAEDYKDRK